MAFMTAMFESFQKGLKKQKKGSKKRKKRYDSPRIKAKNRSVWQGFAKM
jgi:hypothetical protein